MNSEKHLLLICLVGLFGIIAVALIWSSFLKSSTSFPAGTLPADLAASITEPKLPPVRSTDPTRGSEDPKAVSIIEFADYACLYCRVAELEIAQVMANESTPIRVVWRDLPITDDHPDSLMASTAARCAGDQHKFWEMHDALLTASSLAVESLRKLAQGIGLNMTTFNACLSSGKHISPIQNDVALARSHGISGAPTLFIGKKILTGTFNANDIAAAVRSAAR